MNSEIHLFVIWSKAMDKAEEIITKISLRFDILDIFLLRWSPRFFSDNLSRFYGTSLPDGSLKEKHCGRGNFCLIIVRDSSPVYGICQTTAGKQPVYARQAQSNHAMAPGARPPLQRGDAVSQLLNGRGVRRAAQHKTKILFTFCSLLYPPSSL